MSTAITPQELELEAVELLPARETLCGCSCYQDGGYSSSSNYEFNVLSNNAVNVGILSWQSANGGGNQFAAS